MNWDAIGAVGEIVGAIAVVLTLIYLAVQVRHSRELLEESKKIALGQISQGNASFRLELQRYWAQPHLTEIRAKVEKGEAQYNEEHLANFDELSLTEKMQWKSVQAHFAIMIDDGLYQSSLGLISEKEREALEKSVKFSMPYWEHYENYVPSRLKFWYEKHKND